MSTILFEGERAEQLDALADRPRRLSGSMLLWVDLHDPSRDDVDEVAKEFGLDDESVERLMDPSDGVSFRDRREYIHVTASAPGQDADAEPSEIECVVGDNWVVTAHERPAAVLDQFAELAAGSGRTGDLDGPMFLAGCSSGCSTSIRVRSSGSRTSSRRSTREGCVARAIPRTRSSIW